MEKSSGRKKESREQGTNLTTRSDLSQEGARLFALCQVWMQTSHLLCSVQSLKGIFTVWGWENVSAVSIHQ